MLKTSKQNKKSQQKKSKVSAKEMEDMMKNQMEIFELKNTVTEAQEQKERMEERINELEDKTVEMTKCEQQRESEMEQKMNKALVACGTIIWDLIFML